MKSFLFMFVVVTTLYTKKGVIAFLFAKSSEFLENIFWERICMRIKDKLYMDQKELILEGPITIVAFGDSVTHGAVTAGVFDYESVYWNRLKKKLHAVKNYVPINVINAGIGGVTAKGSLPRLEKQVLAYMPDLVIVCFGLNDVNEKLEDYLEALQVIFSRCKEIKADVIFMTPNMLNTYVSEQIVDNMKAYAELTATYQNGGKMDLFMEEACKLAERMKITVCDCYSAWKELSKTQDTTKLLANRINHPTREMHQLFANMLYDIIMNGNEDVDKKTQDEDAMYKNN